jgi:hypothetical protein
MAGSQTCTGVAVEIFIKEDIVAPVGVFLELLRLSINRSPAIGIARERTRSAASDFLRNFIQVHIVSRTGGTLDFEVVAAKRIHAEESADDQAVHWEPNGSAPI